MRYDEIIKKLSTSQQYNDIAKTNQVNSFLPIKFQIDLDKSELTIMSAFLSLSVEKMAAEMLTMLDYMTYIPFGRRGIDFAKEYIKPNGESLEEMKKQAMFNILKINNIKIDYNIKNSIEKFCHYLFSNKQDLSQIESLAATIRQIEGELDFLYSKGELVGVDNNREEMVEKILDRIWDNVKNTEKKFDISRFLPKSTKKLSENEIAYFNMIKNLTTFDDLDKDYEL